MKTFTHILFPVDFSARCQATRSLVESWARRFNAKVTLLHTIQIPISAYGGPDGYPIVVDIPAMEQIANQRLEQFEFPGAARVAKVGDPALEIVQYAEKNAVDLIMMPTHGYGAFRSLLLGSTAAKVLHDSHCPVWTNAHSEDPSAASEIHNILCAVETETGDLVRSAEELAQAFGAKLKTVHVEGGHVPQMVREAALETHAGLVVTGPGKAHETFGQLRSNTYAIIRDSPCPVLSL
jgi:nucleotide-binding universal stress UspA family protein